MIINQNPGLNKPDYIGVSVKNADTVAIPNGSPIVLAFNGTDDGLAVVLPSTANSLLKIIAFGYGVSAGLMNVGDVGNAIIFGTCFSLLLELQSRTSSSVNWASGSTIPAGIFLSIDTVNNMWTTYAGAVTYQFASNSTAATPSTVTLQPGLMALLAQSVNSYSSSASATSDTRTALTIAVKAFVRFM